MSQRSDLTALLEHTDWLGALAHSLAKDAHAAADLVQDAWVAALDRPPALDRPVRGWLASLVRHRWIDLQRQGRRRRARERAAARGEAQPSAHDVVEKAVTQARLVEAVLQLDEPFRTTVLLRFFEGLPQREIAHRMQTSTATVNGRLGRALARLRVALAREQGRGGWLHVLVPLLREPPPPAPAILFGAVAMKAASIAAVLVLSAITGLMLWVARPAAVAPLGDRVEQKAPAPLARASDDRGNAPAGLARALPEPERLPVGARAATAGALPPPLPELRMVRGRVLDASGAGVDGLALAVSPAQGEPGVCTSGAGGWFELSVDPAAGPELIVAADPRFATVLAGSASVRGDTQPIVVVAPRIDLAGVVLDPSRAPVAGAVLELRLPAGFGAAWGLALDWSVPQHWRTESRADGRFDLPELPAVDGAVIAVARSGFVPLREPAPPHSAPALELVLDRPEEATGLVRGVVLDAAGARACGALVSAGQDIAETSSNGEFVLDVRLAGTRPRLLALLRGALPAMFEPERDAAGLPLWPTDVVLQVGAPAGVIEGRVVDAGGEPVHGARVWVDDPTPFGRSAEVRLVAESLLRGDERFWSYQETAADGTFALGGLLPRPYRLQAVDPRTLASVERADVQPGSTSVELRLPGDVHARVAGRVTASGEPIEGVTVRLVRITYELEHEGGTDNDSIESESVVTAADGAFEFRAVPVHGVDVIATGDTIFGAAAVLADEPDPTHIDLAATLRLHLQVELQAPHRADRLCVFDRGGKRVVLFLFRGGGSHATHEMPIVDGRSAVLSVAERAATLALYRGDAEVGRVPLHLVPGRTNVVRF